MTLVEVRVSDCASNVAEVLRGVLLRREREQISCVLALFGREEMVGQEDVWRVLDELQSWVPGVDLMKVKLRLVAVERQIRVLGRWLNGPQVIFRQAVHLRKAAHNVAVAYEHAELYKSWLPLPI